MWLAIHRETREIGGVASDAPTHAPARRLWASRPAVDRQCAVCSTAVWEAYAAILPSKRHRACGKESGQPSHSERFTTTVRQRDRRLVRKTRACSKNLVHPSGAIWYFIHAYTVRQRAKRTITTPA